MLLNSKWQSINLDILYKKLINLLKKIQMRNVCKFLYKVNCK